MYILLGGGYFIQTDFLHMMALDRCISIIDYIHIYLPDNTFECFQCVITHGKTKLCIDKSSRTTYMYIHIFYSESHTLLCHEFPCVFHLG